MNSCFVSSETLWRSWAVDSKTSIIQAYRFSLSNHQSRLRLHAFNCCTDYLLEQNSKVITEKFLLEYWIPLFTSMTNSKVGVGTNHCNIQCVMLWFYCWLTGADVRVVDMKRLLGSGILHTKFIIADNRSFYLGSANMDWRSLTQVCMFTVDRGNVQYCRQGWCTLL